MNKKTIDYQEQLLKTLKKDSELSVAYLNTALEDDDPRVFLLALRNVIEANDDTFASVAKQAHLNRENLYRMLSTKGNPKLTSITSLLNTLGLQLTIQSNKK